MKHKGVSVKLFLGYLLTPELKLHLERSPQWQQDQIGTVGAKPLTRIPHEGQEYLGAFCEESPSRLPALQALHKTLAQHVRQYCPEYTARLPKACLFPQVFLA